MLTYSYLLLSRVPHSVSSVIESYSLRLHCESLPFFSTVSCNPLSSVTCGQPSRSGVVLPVSCVLCSYVHAVTVLLVVTVLASCWRLVVVVVLLCRVVAASHMFYAPLLDRSVYDVFY